MPRPPQPTTGDELTILCDTLDRQRAQVVRRCSGLTQEQLARTLGPSPLTLAGLLKHLALVEDGWFTGHMLDRPLPEPWASAPSDDADWDFHSALDDTPETLLQLYADACERSRAVVAELGSLDARSARPTRIEQEPSSLRWVLIHLIEETARHAGHADLIRESIDGDTSWYD